MDNIPEFYESDAEWEAGEDGWPKLKSAEVTHTKGEWVAKDRAVIAKCFTGEWKNIVDKVRGGNPVEADANARLIAAAPQLFDALKRAVAVLDADGIRYGDCDEEALDVLSAAREAVSKAEGR